MKCTIDIGINLEETTMAISRRDFGRLAALGVPAACLERSGFDFKFPPLPSTPPVADEKFWDAIQRQFILEPGLSVMNAASLCPSSAPVLESMYRNTRDIDTDPSMDNRVKMSEGKETTRKLLAEFLRVTPDEIGRPSGPKALTSRATRARR